MGYKHPLNRVYSSFEEARKVAKCYLDSKQITRFFIFSTRCDGLITYGIAYSENSLLDFDYEGD